MPRRPRVCPGGLAYHVMNRAAGLVNLFEDDGDYAAFERVLAEATERFGMRLCAYVQMPNHFHLVLWPRGDGEVSHFMRWLTMTHTQRWHAHRGTAGRGHLYQGRFKCFPVQRDEHFLKVCRYVERNPLRANLVARARDWRWSSLWRREFAGGPQDEGPAPALALCEWPVPRPRDWGRRVDAPETVPELEALRRACRRGSPYGGGEWTKRTAARLGATSSLRPIGRPRKRPATARQTGKIGS